MQVTIDWTTDDYLDYFVFNEIKNKSKTKINKFGSDVTNSFKLSYAWDALLHHDFIFNFIPFIYSIIYLIILFIFIFIFILFLFLIYDAIIFTFDRQYF